MRGRKHAPTRTWAINRGLRKLLFFIVFLGSMISLGFIFISTENHSTELNLQEVPEEERHLHFYEGESRWKSLVEASANVQNRLHYLMHPKNCSSTKKLYCRWAGRRCGFGCTIHRLTPCLSAAYKLQRTPYLDLSQSFDNAGGFELWFKPLSSCKKSEFNLKEAVDLQSAEAWEGFAKVKNDIPLVSCQTLSESPRWPLPLYVFNHAVPPPDIIEGIEGLHDNPGLWFVGQLAYYLIGNLAPNFKATLEEIKNRIGYTHPIVAAHIRRGDKIIQETYAVDEKLYMEEIQNIFDKYYPDLKERKVFLATDDDQIKRELHMKWPEYKFISHQDSNSSGEYFKSGYDQQGLSDVLFDFYLVMEADYTVCTFSSNFCRLQHEMKQAIFTDSDATEQTTSVDREYFMFKPFDWKILLAIEDHQASFPDEISFKKGDFIEDALVKTEWNLHGRTIAYSKGLHRASGKRGRYPLRKVIDYPGEMDYPSYDFL